MLKTVSLFRFSKVTIDEKPDALNEKENESVKVCVVTSQPALRIRDLSPAEAVTKTCNGEIVPLSFKFQNNSSIDITEYSLRAIVEYHYPETNSGACEEKYRNAQTLESIVDGLSPFESVTPTADHKYSKGKSIIELLQHPDEKVLPTGKKVEKGSYLLNDAVSIFNTKELPKVITSGQEVNFCANVHSFLGLQTVTIELTYCNSQTKADVTKDEDHLFRRTLQCRFDFIVSPLVEVCNVSMNFDYFYEVSADGFSVETNDSCARCIVDVANCSGVETVNVLMKSGSLTVYPQSVSRLVIPVSHLGLVKAEHPYRELQKQLTAVIWEKGLSKIHGKVISPDFGGFFPPFAVRNIPRIPPIVSAVEFKKDNGNRESYTLCGTLFNGGKDTIHNIHVEVSTELETENVLWLGSLSHHIDNIGSGENMEYSVTFLASPGAFIDITVTKKESEGKSKGCWKYQQRFATSSLVFENH